MFIFTTSFLLIYSNWFGCNNLEDQTNTIKSQEKYQEKSESSVENVQQILIFPVFACISTGPSSARLLYVPWKYMSPENLHLEKKDGELWTEVNSITSKSDSLVAENLNDGDELRIFLTDQNNKKIAQSVVMKFSSASTPSNTVFGRTLIEGKEKDWIVDEETIKGIDSKPEIGDILSLPLTNQQISPDFRIVEDIWENEGKWDVSTSVLSNEKIPVNEKHRLSSRTTNRGFVDVNMSLDGIQTQMLTDTSKGHKGYCSKSGYGCIEFSLADLERVTPKNVFFGSGNVGYDYPLDNASPNNQPISMSIASSELGNGMDYNATITGGVKSELDYDYSWKSINNIDIASIPYANGTVSLSLSNSVPNNDITESLFTSANIIISISGIRITTNFGVDAIIALESDNNTVTGDWTASVELSKRYNLGYRNKFYGPLQAPLSIGYSLIPSFNDGSSGHIWFGWEARVSSLVEVMFIDAARGNLSARTGLVFVHDSSLGTNCGKNTSILQTSIDEGFKVDADLTIYVPIFSDYYKDFNLIDSRKTLYSWGRKRQLSLPTSISSDDVMIPFRIKTVSNPSNSVGDVDISDTSILTAFISGNGTSLQSNIVQSNDRYNIELEQPLSTGIYNIAIWLPEIDLPVFRGEGQCLVAEIEVK